MPINAASNAHIRMNQSNASSIAAVRIATRAAMSSKRPATATVKRPRRDELFEINACPADRRPRKALYFWRRAPFSFKVKVLAFERLSPPAGTVKVVPGSRFYC
jgi:hypothetical protein